MEGIYVCVSAKSLELCPTLCDPMDCIAHQAPLSMGLPRQEYWGGGGVAISFSRESSQPRD